MSRSPSVKRVSQPGTLFEAASKALLQTYGVPIAMERERLPPQRRRAHGGHARPLPSSKLVVRDRPQGPSQPAGGQALAPPSPARGHRTTVKATLRMGGDASSVAPMVSGSRGAIAGVVRGPPVRGQHHARSRVVAEAIADVQFRLGNEIDAGGYYRLPGSTGSCSRRFVAEPPSIESNSPSLVSALATARTDVVVVDV